MFLLTIQYQHSKPIEDWPWKLQPKLLSFISDGTTSVLSSPDNQSVYASPDIVTIIILRIFWYADGHTRHVVSH